ncbi:MAG TPA: hypothetical protein VGF48_18700 [Thermoanaerobaculia bacterium]|jgi:hypothetical protein
MVLHQTRAVAFQAGGRLGDALESLVTFGAFAERLGSRVHLRNFHTQAGLILHTIACTRNREAVELAQLHFDEALRQWKETVSASQIANAAYLAAANERVFDSRCGKRWNASGASVRAAS